MNWKHKLSISCLCVIILIFIGLYGFKLYIINKNKYFRNTELLVNKKNVKDVDDITYKLMEFSDNLFNKLGVRYFVTDGTLLGIVRNNKRIEYDNDIDIRIHPDDWYKFQNYLEQLPTENIPNTNYVVKISEQGIDKWVQIYTKNENPEYDFIHADFVKADYIYKYWWYDQSYAFDDPLERTKFGFVDVYKPSKKYTDKALTKTYGKNYIYPESDIRNIIRKYYYLFKNKDNLTNNNDIKISVIILSYNRPENLNKSIPKLVEMDNIDEIIILHGHKNYVNHINHPKVRDIDDWDNNEKYYTMKRFKNVNLAKNESILFLDDDVIPSKKLLDKLISNYKEDEDNLYGPLKRKCDDSGYYYLWTEKLWNWILPIELDYNVILTPVLLTSKSVVNDVWNTMNSQEYKPYYDTVLNNRGNGEDLLFNKIYRDTYNKKPIHIGGKIKYLNTKNGFSTKNSLKHTKIRNEFCKRKENITLLNNANKDNLSIALFTFSTRLEKFQPAWKINEAYCKKWGYDCYPFEERKMKDLHPMWERYFFLLQLLDKGYDVVMYVDDDAYVHDFDLSVSYWLNRYPKKDIIMAEENSKHENKYINVPKVNSGVMICRNTKWTKKFIHDVLYSNICKRDDIKGHSDHYDQPCIYNLMKNIDVNKHFGLPNSCEFNCRYNYNFFIKHWNNLNLFNAIHCKPRLCKNPFVHHLMGDKNDRTVSNSAKKFIEKNNLQIYHPSL